MTTLIIDADGCPVRENATRIGKKNGFPVVVVCDINHMINDKYAKVITVDKGIDAADFRILSMLKANDIVVTQDYGLASLVLSKGGYAIDQNGMQYTEENIEMLLLRRHVSKHIRRSGGKTKGPAKRKREDDLAFEESLKRLIKQIV